MRTLEARAVAQDAYPAGLHLASTLWATIAKDKNANVTITGIRSFWDGVRMEGQFRSREFWVEINYATDTVVLLTIQTKKRFLEMRRAHAQLESELKNLLEQFLEGIEGRKLSRSPQPTDSSDIA
jgi:hypothetical protein